MSCNPFTNTKKFNKSKACLVLSVGGIKGISHIGAIDALKEKGYEFDCIFGNSIGAFIGSIYAIHPSYNIQSEYRNIIQNYVEQTKNDKLESAFLLGAIALIVSGGTIGWETLAAGYIGSEIIGDFSISRFETILNKYYSEINIDETTIPFSTSYYLEKNNSIGFNIAKHGNLAKHVSNSTSNPFIFSDTDLSIIDPGLDRAASTPINDTCELFEPDLIIALNVSGQQPVWNKNGRCKVKIINIKIDDIDKIDNAFLGVGKEYNYLYDQGFATVQGNL